MTEKELQDILAIVEDIIAKKNGDVCHQVADLICKIKTSLKMQYQQEITFVINQINTVLTKHNIDCLTIDRVSGEEIADYVEKNVPPVTPLNNNKKA